MKKIFTCIAGIIILASGIRAEDVRALMDSAAVYYDQAEYHLSIEKYHEVRGRGYNSAELQYNLGNAYFKKGELAESILHYERARLLAPNDADIAFNLKLAQQHVTDQVEAVKEVFLKVWIEKMQHWWTSKTWVLISISFFVLCIALLIWMLIRHNTAGKGLIFGLAIFSLILSALSLGFSLSNYKQITANDDAIVFESVLVKSSPNETGINLFEIHEGLKVSMLDSLNNYTEIRLADGKQGWVPRNTIEPVRIQEE